ELRRLVGPGQRLPGGAKVQRVGLDLAGDAPQGGGGELVPGCVGDVLGADGPGCGVDEAVRAARGDRLHHSGTPGATLPCRGAAGSAAAASAARVLLAMSV